MDNNTAVIEIAEFRLAAGVSDESFIALVDELEQGFHGRQKGFGGTELAKGGNGVWIMVQRWATIEDAKAVIALMMRDPGTLPFREALNPSTVKLTLFRSAGAWPA